MAKIFTVSIAAIVVCSFLNSKNAHSGGLGQRSAQSETKVTVNAVDEDTVYQVKCTQCNERFYFPRRQHSYYGPFLCPKCRSQQSSLNGYEDYHEVY